ncbi:hypothetical protein BN1086_01026 [Citrobacter koseri]|uniref:Uncharacterized protein n=1 Tax=Citrobacter koseri TaxID=545 RepID=A0A078LCZ1_CITKO|nr:hypothetical protein BN1086_01026 [Citrobacter koseri]
MKSTVETKIIELVKSGHERAADLKASCGAVDVRSLAQLISDLASQLEVQFARSNALAAKLSMINGLMDAAEQANKLAQEATEKLVQERDALAAENAGLKSVVAENWNMRDVLRQLIAGRPGGVYFNKWEPLIFKVLNATPATTSFMAEVRASCVDADKQKISDAISGCYQDEIVGLDAAVNIASEFSAQLRKGVQS